jgi:hypothetical protein
MSETWLPVASQNVITVRLEPTSVEARDLAGLPALYLPLQLQLLLAGQNSDVQYTLVRMAGKLQNQPIGEFASFDLGPLAEVPSSRPFFRQQEAIVALDRQRIKRFEDARAGKNACFQISMSCLLWHRTQQNFEVARSSGYLEVDVPRSHWIDKVTSVWNLSNTRHIEIEFPKSGGGEHFKASYAKVETAERLFAGGQWKQTLAELHSAFEGLANSHGFNRPDQQFFAGMLSGLHPAKKEKFKLALDGFCDLLHLGRHEPKEATETFAVSPSDARFALTMAYAIFEYITPKI